MPKTAASITPDDLDREAARLFDTAAWQKIVSGWQYTAPEPSYQPKRAASQGTWRDLISVPVDQLVDQALRDVHPGAPTERPLPGRFGAMLPDRVHSWRRLGQPDIRPSAHLAYARQLLTEWGWQNAPYKLRDARGARCICGAMISMSRMGCGSMQTVNRAGAWLITELRSQGWYGLVGEWNRAPGRTADQAFALIDATIRRASHAGQ